MKKTFIFKLSGFIVMTTINFSCVSSVKPENKNSLSNSPENVSEEIMIQNDTVKFNREAYLNQYLDSLRIDLKKGVISSFLYNECLDNISASYFYLNSHTKLSLRFDLIQKITIEEAEKIISLSNATQFNKTCSAKKEFMPYASKTTWELLNTRAKGE